jgi:hypothetical protein
MRGQRLNWWLGATLIPTFHPAAALRGQPRVKEQMQEDFALVKGVLGEPAPKIEESEPVQDSLDLA